VGAVLTAKEHYAPVECNVEEIVEGLLVEDGGEDEVAVLLFMLNHDAVLLSAVQLALGGGRYYASSRVARAVLQSLIARRLVRRLDIRYRRRRITVYTLTDCGLAVARTLAGILGVQQP
jgi:hypothetical protein